MPEAPDFFYTVEQVKALSGAVIKELEEKLKVLVNIPGPQRDFRNTMLAFERAVSDFGEVFGARFEPAPLNTWHKDVRAYEVKNPDGSLAAYFYFDLFPREGKHKHAACFSLLDMRYHTTRGKVDTTKVYGRLMKKIALIPLSPDCRPQASFGHLMCGYGAGYYSYLWSEVIAQDLFGAFEASGVLNPETGKKYRELILAPGRSCDEAGQVEKFLGRPAAEDAFLKSIGAA